LDYYVNVVTDASYHLWITCDFGRSWADLNSPANSNLLFISGHTSVDTFQAAASFFVPVQIGGVTPLVVATGFGVFVTFTTPTSTTPLYEFQRLGANLPNTLPTTFMYDATGDVLSLATLGRGVWQMQQIKQVLQMAANGQSVDKLDPGCRLPLYPNVPNSYYFDASLLPAGSQSIVIDVNAVLQFSLAVDFTQFPAGTSELTYTGELVSEITQLLSIPVNPTRLTVTVVPGQTNSFLTVTVQLTPAKFANQRTSADLANTLLQLVNNPGSVLTGDLLKSTVPGSAVLLRFGSDSPSSSSDSQWRSATIAFIVLFLVSLIVLGAVGVWAWRQRSRHVQDVNAKRSTYQPAWNTAPAVVTAAGLANNPIHGGHLQPQDTSLQSAIGSPSAVTRSGAHPNTVADVELQMRTSQDGTNQV
jgi:hypothetical protein